MKKILEVYDVEWKMNLAERILVVPDPEVSYNLRSGGKGGWDYINNNKDIKARAYKNHHKFKHTEEFRKKISIANLGRKPSIKSIRCMVNTRIQNGSYILSEETKKKMSLSRLGNKNPMFGKKRPDTSERNRITAELRRKQNDNTY